MAFYEGYGNLGILLEGCEVVIDDVLGGTRLD